MSVSGWLAAADGLVALWLLLGVPRQQRNKAGVIVVASFLLGISGWLAVLAADGPAHVDQPAQLPATGDAA